MESLLSLRGISKRFPGILANDSVDLDILPGEIHGLLGENGAGKTTLMNCIYGLYTPDSGKVFWKGQEVRINNSRSAIELGIGMVHQHFMLVHNFTALESIVLGMNVTKGPFLSLKKIEGEIKALIDQYGLHVDLDAEIWQLSVGAQQRVEIIKALYRKAELLILDEPTAVLTPQETKEFFQILRKLRDDHHSVIIITHKLDEIMELSDRVTVLRGGKVVSTMETRDANPNLLASAMVGREFDFSYQKEMGRKGNAVLTVKNLCCLNDMGLPALKDITFQLCQGEILGIAGVSGNGQTELSEALTGMRPVTSGSAVLNGREITGKSPRELYEMKLSHIPEDRQAVGLIMDFSVKENCVMGVYEKEPFSTKGRVHHKAVEEQANFIIDKYDVRTSGGADSLTRLLSGGNQQKIILGREIEKKPELLIAVQPTRGLDIAATEFVQSQLLKVRDEKTAIIYTSTELEEILKMCDKILVLFEGRQYGPFAYGEVDLDAIGLMMAGSYREKVGAEAQDQASNKDVSYV